MTDPAVLDAEIAVTTPHSTAEIPEPAHKQPLVDFDLMMQAAHNDEEADQAVDALFSRHDFGRLHA
jgi:hypothetical protein